METVLNFVLLCSLGIAIVFIVIYAAIAFLLDKTEIK
jgi:hypothetical protein